MIAVKTTVRVRHRSGRQMEDDARAAIGRIAPHAKSLHVLRITPSDVPNKCDVYVRWFVDQKETADAAQS